MASTAEPLLIHCKAPASARLPHCALLIGMCHLPAPRTRSVPQDVHLLRHHLLRAERCGHGRLPGRLLLGERCVGCLHGPACTKPLRLVCYLAVPSSALDSSQACMFPRAEFARPGHSVPMPPANRRGQPRPRLADGLRAGRSAHRLLHAGGLRGQRLRRAHRRPGWPVRQKGCAFVPTLLVLTFRLTSPHAPI